MYYYRSTEYLCLCGDTARDVKTKLPAALASSRWRLPDLYFCPNCLQIKCPHCCTVTVECKYCASCMTDYTDGRGVTRCQKNCFVCPECTSPLVVAVENCETPRGKRFGFLCGACDYSYRTRVVTKPAPLATIVRTERDSAYGALAAHWAAKRGARRAGTERADAATAVRLSRMGLTSATQLDATNEDALGARIDAALAASGGDAMAASGGDAMAATGGDTMAAPAPRLPVSAHLAAKRAYACGVCRTPLAQPSRDPQLMKLAHKRFAVDTVPTVAARTADGALTLPYCETACVLSVINPLASSITVTASIVLQNPYGASVALPITCFSVQGRTAAPPQSVPTPYLTAGTSRARAEQLERAVRRTASTGLQVGPNWTAVPFTVTMDARTHATVPFYFTVEELERGVKYGFWALVHVECPASGEV